MFQDVNQSSEHISEEGKVTNIILFICIFPEGNRTFSGELGYIDYSIVKLIKKINKGIGHIRFTSIFAHVVLITVIKSYLPQILG